MKKNETSLLKDLQHDTQYQGWIIEISQRFKRSQIKAAIKVNNEMLHFYWSLGRDIYQRSSQFSNGSGFYRQVSLDLQKALPDVKSFSVTNLKYMKYFYELYSTEHIRQQLVDDIGAVVEDCVCQGIFQIPWGHNVVIMDKCKTNQEKAIFYVCKTLENNWSRSVLLNFLDTDLFERQGKAISNFDKTLPVPLGELAQQITKDPYNFDFLTMTDRLEEKELKSALIQNIERFLMELGRGFAYMGREYRLEIGNEERFLDMLFYHTGLHSYVVIEVKVQKFDPADLGQLGFYVSAVNHILKKDGDNPTIGLLVCKTKDNVVAQYALEGTTLPLGISEYELSKLYPGNFRCSLPTIEEIEAELMKNN